MRKLRYRLAGWLLGGPRPKANFPLHESGGWLVQYDAEKDWMFALRIQSWRGELTTAMVSFDEQRSPAELADLIRRPRSSGTFSGTFGE